VTLDDYNNQPAHVVRDLTLHITRSNQQEIERLQKARKS